MNKKELAELDRWLTEKMGWEYPHYIEISCEGPGYQVYESRKFMPTRRIEQAWLPLEKVIGDGHEGATPMIYFSSGSWWCRLSGLGTAHGAAEPEEAICLAVKEAWEKGGEK